MPASPGPEGPSAGMSEESVEESPASIAEPSPHRIKRNTACINCRDSKVKCNASTRPGQPCLRCSKLHLQCVVDKSHKRVSRRSKLEELVQEVQNIKQAVGTRPSTSATPAELPSLTPVELPQLTVPPLRDGPLNHGSFQMPPMRPLGPGPLPEPRALTPALTAQTTPSSSGKVSEPRALKSRVFSGQDIDYYFDKYFDHFHPYLPIARIRNPDACYKAGPLLFWAIIVTACRRYSRDDTVLPFLIESVQSETWSTISAPPLSVSTMNALLIISAWPLASIRLLRDPSMIYTSIVMNSCFLIGLHTGRGDHAEFTYPLYRLQSTQEEAVFTWAGYNIISQKVAAYAGIPSIGQLFNQSIDSMLDRTCPISLPNYFLLLLDTAKFSSRLSKIMATTLENNRGVPHQLVDVLEEDLHKLQHLVTAHSTELNHFTFLMALLDVQTYYFLPVSNFSPEILKRNVFKCFNTAQAAIYSCRKLDQELQFISHSPHYVCRSILTSTCVILSVLMSAWANEFTSESSQTLMADALATLRAFTVQDGDLPIRAASMLENAWMARELLPKVEISKMPFTNFSHRLGMSLTMGCLRRWKEEFEQIRPAQSQNVPNAPNTQGTPIPGNASLQQSLDPAADPTSMSNTFSQIDWDVFMQDFDWNFDPQFLTVPALGPT